MPSLILLFLFITLLTIDRWKVYKDIGEHFLGGHETVNHGIKEYDSGDVYPNTAESFFALLKRNVYGSFHHVSKKHLHRYSNAFSFRWNNRKMKDGERTIAALGMTEEK